MTINHVMTVTDGHLEVTVSVDEDKQSGGVERMKAQALSRARMPRGHTTWVKDNWTK